MKKGSPLNDEKIMEETIKIAKEEYGKEKTDEILKEITKERNNFKVLSWNDLKNYECPQYKWRVQYLLQDKKIIIISGSSAVYKSWLCLDLGLCVATGKPFLDNFQVEQGGVLFIDRENSIPELQTRVDMVAKGLNIVDENIPMFFLSEQSLRLDDYDGRDFLQKYIQENNIKLVVVDTYRRVVTFEENNADAVSLLFTEYLKPICEQTGASFVFIHHHKKGKSEGDEKEMLRGSSDLVNFVDGVIQISRKGQKLVVKQTKNRSGKELNPFEVTIDTDEEEYFKFEYHGEKHDFSVLSRAVECLCEWIARDNVKTFKTKEGQILCLGAGIKKMGYFNALSELEKRGILLKTSHGMYQVLSQNRDLSDSPKSTIIYSGQLDKLSDTKSSCPNSPIGQCGQLDKVMVSDVKQNNQDLGIVQSSVYNNTELLNKLSTNKSSSSNSSIEQSELLNKTKVSDRDTQYFEAKECENIKVEHTKEEVLEYLKSNPTAKTEQLIEQFGPSVLRFKKEGLF